jgi:formylmethanofuran dehydrogenase subunit E
MDKTLIEKAVAFHGHECPGLAIGIKACEAVIQKLGVQSAPDEELVCIAETDACGVDAIQAILGCTIGKGNLIVKFTGKHVFSFFDRTKNKQIRLYFSSSKKTEMDREHYLQYVLDAGVDELFTCSEPKLPFPAHARIYPAVKCEICGEYAAESCIRIYESKRVCLDCFDKLRGSII